MARTKNIDIEVLTEREKKLSEKLKQIRARRRAISRTQHEQRIKRIVELAEKAGLDRVSDAALESEFKRIVAEHTATQESHRNHNTGVATEANQEIAEESSEPRRKWFGGS